MDPNTTIAPFNPAAVSTPAAPVAPRQIAPNVQAVGFSDESVQKYEFLNYQGRTGYTDRIYVLCSEDAVKARVHYHDKLKGAVLCQSVYTRNAAGTQENLAQEAFCCKHLGSPQPRFAVPIIHYATDKNGNPSNPFSLDQKVWKFGADKYAQLREVNKHYPLGTVDLSAVCTDEKFQKMNIGAIPPASCWFMAPGFPAAKKQEILTWAKAAIPKLPRELGRIYTEPELLKAMQEAGILTGAIAAPQMSSALDNPVADFSSILGPGIGGGTVVGEQGPQS